MNLPKIELPTYTITLPSNDAEIKFRPFTVKERKILLMALESGKEDDMTESVKQIARNCIITDYDLDTFTNFDLEYFFLNLKARSISEVTPLAYICRNETANTVDGNTVMTSCNTSIKIEYNVLNTKVIRNPEHTKKIELENGVGVMMKYPTISNSIISSKGGTATGRAFKFIASCIDYIWDANSIYYSKDSTEEELITWLEDLPDTPFKKIEKFFDTMPFMQDTLEFKCPKCGFEHKSELEGLTNFFA